MFMSCQTCPSILNELFSLIAVFRYTGITFFYYLFSHPTLLLFLDPELLAAVIHCFTCLIYSDLV